MREVDLLPPDEVEASTPEALPLDRHLVLWRVIEALDSEDSPLYRLIDPALKEPHEPGRARESLTVLAGVGQEILNLVASEIEVLANLSRGG